MNDGQAAAAVNIMLAVLVIYGDFSEDSADYIIKKLNRQLIGMKFTDITFDKVLTILREIKRSGA